MIKGYWVTSSWNGSSGGLCVKERSPDVPWSIKGGSFGPNLQGSILQGSRELRNVYDDETLSVFYEGVVGEWFTIAVLSSACAPSPRGSGSWKKNRTVNTGDKLDGKRFASSMGGSSTAMICADTSGTRARATRTSDSTHETRPRAVVTKFDAKRIGWASVTLIRLH